MEELETEKDKLRAMQIDTTNQAIDSYLMKDCLKVLYDDIRPEEMSAERSKASDDVSIYD